MNAGKTANLNILRKYHMVSDGHDNAFSKEYRKRNAQELLIMLESLNVILGNGTEDDYNVLLRMSDIDKSEEAIEQLLEDYKDVFEKLKKQQEMGNLSDLSYSAIIKLTHSVAYKLTMKRDNVQKKVGDFMGGKVLDLPEFKIYDQGVMKGRAEGEEERKKLAEEIVQLRIRIKELEETSKDNN